jgi:hypothetical protein
LRGWARHGLEKRCNKDVARLGEKGLILVIPEGGSSYYVNAVEHPQDRYPISFAIAGATGLK